jgi:hypothetical protein
MGRVGLLILVTFTIPFILGAVQTVVTPVAETSTPLNLSTIHHPSVAPFQPGRGLDSSRDRQSRNCRPIASHADAMGLMNLMPSSYEVRLDIRRSRAIAPHTMRLIAIH